MTFRSVLSLAFEAAALLQTRNAVYAPVWHLLPFVRSLQTAFYGFDLARNFEGSPRTQATTCRTSQRRIRYRGQLALTNT